MTWGSKCDIAAYYREIEYALSHLNMKSHADNRIYEKLWRHHLTAKWNAAVSEYNLASAIQPEIILHHGAK